MHLNANTLVGIAFRSRPEPTLLLGLLQQEEAVRFGGILAALLIISLRSLEDLWPETGLDEILDLMSVKEAKEYELVVTTVD
ncbi:unnamed protein product [Calypogeia fissa]